MRSVFAIDYTAVTFQEKPDVVFPARRKTIFVHGCFWHGHNCARGSRKPKTNSAYWSSKIARNAARDAASAKSLRRLGWSVLVIWECQMKEASRLSRRLKKFLEL
jgi:DNA mismatch endonuclease (patch repair protein)